MKKFLMVMLTVVFFAGIGFCGNSNVGTTGAQFMKIIVSPKVAALGGAYTSFSDVNSVLINPAGIADVKDKSMSLAWTKWIADTSLGYLAFAMPWSKKDSFGIGIDYFDSGSIEGYKADASPAAAYSATSMLVSLAYGRKFTSALSLGVSLKYISETIDDKSAASPTLDLGARYTFNKKAAVGVSLQNLFGEMKFISQSDKLPMAVKVGGNYNIMDNLGASLEIALPNDNDISYGAGFEYRVFVNDFYFPIRLGYRSISGIEGLTGITAGLGFGFNAFSLDLAWRPYGELGNPLNAGFGYKF